MEKVTLQELGFPSRTEALAFLKQLWQHEKMLDRYAEMNWNCAASKS